MVEEKFVALGIDLDIVSERERGVVYVVCVCARGGVGFLLVLRLRLGFLLVLRLRIVFLLVLAWQLRQASTSRFGSCIHTCLPTVSVGRQLPGVTYATGWAYIWVYIWFLCGCASV